MEPELISEMVLPVKLRQLNKMYRTMSFRSWIRSLLYEGRLEATFEYTVKYIEDHPESVYWMSLYEVKYSRYDEDKHSHSDYIGFSAGGGFEITNHKYEHLDVVLAVKQESKSLAELLHRVNSRYTEPEELLIIPSYLTLYHMTLEDPNNAVCISGNEAISFREVAMWVIGKVSEDVDTHRKEIDESGDTPEVRHLHTHRLYLWIYYNCIELGLDVEHIEYEAELSIAEWRAETDMLTTLLVDKLKARLLG